MLCILPPIVSETIRRPMPYADLTADISDVIDLLGGCPTTVAINVVEPVLKGAVIYVRSSVMLD